MSDSFDDDSYHHYRLIFLYKNLLSDFNNLPFTCIDNVDRYIDTLYDALISTGS